MVFKQLVKFYFILFISFFISDTAFCQNVDSKEKLTKEKSEQIENNSTTSEGHFNHQIKSQLSPSMEKGKTLPFNPSDTLYTEEKKTPKTIR